MPFARPTLAELISRAAADYETELPGTDARLRRSNLGAMSRVQAAGAHGLHGYLVYLARQLMVDTADGEYLVRWAALWGVTRLAATFASGSATASGVNGTIVPVNTLLQRADGRRFKTTASATVAAGSVTLPLIASSAGADGNTAASSVLSFIEPVSGVAATATVTVAGLDKGADVESDDSLRLRVMARMQQPPMGGSKADYITWARQVAGVTRAWCFPLEGGPGKVVVRFVRDDDSGSIIPSAGEVSAVQAHIDTVRPVTATVTVAAPTALALNPNISITPDTATIRDAVAQEIADFLRREGAPGVRLYVSRLREVISGAAGEFDSQLVSPAADVVPTASQIPTLGTITWS